MNTKAHMSSFLEFKNKNNRRLNEDEVNVIFIFIVYTL